MPVVSLGAILLDPYWQVDGMVELNVTSTSRMTYLVLPGMLERKKGCVVNMSSAAAQNPSPLLSQCVHRHKQRKRPL
jgi:17beta-estradiol 17-dehydrogenase / very-long-chain 3-oxoacyl-CoA reductase